MDPTQGLQTLSQRDTTPFYTTILIAESTAGSCGVGMHHTMHPDSPTSTSTWSPYDVAITNTALSAVLPCPLLCVSTPTLSDTAGPNCVRCIVSSRCMWGSTVVLAYARCAVLPFRGAPPAFSRRPARVGRRRPDRRPRPTGGAVFMPTRPPARADSRPKSHYHTDSAAQNGTSQGHPPSTTTDLSS